MSVQDLAVFDHAAAGLPLERLRPGARQRHRLMFDGQCVSPVAPRRRGPIVVAASLGLVGVATAASLGQIWREPEDRTTALCYASADLSARNNFFEFAVATPTDGPMTDAVSQGESVCTGAWRQGRLLADPAGVDLDPLPGPGDRPVPALVGCVLAGGRLGIFPGTTSTCEQLGLDLALT